MRNLVSKRWDCRIKSRQELPMSSSPLLDPYLALGVPGPWVGAESLGTEAELVLETKVFVKYIEACFGREDGMPQSLVERLMLKIIENIPE